MHVSQKPLTQLQMKDILLGVIDDSIKNTDDIKDNVDREYYRYIWIDDWFKLYLPPITQYKVPDDVKDYDNYTQIAYLSPNQETWSNEYVKYVFPDDFDKVPEGAFGRNWKNTKYGIIGHKNIFIKLSKLNGYNIKFIVDKPKDTGDDYNVRVRLIGSDNYEVTKNIHISGDLCLDIKVSDIEFLNLWFNKNIVIKEVEFTPLDIDEPENSNTGFNIIPLDKVFNANNITPVSAVPHIFVSGWYGNEGSHIWGGKIAELILPIDNKLALYEINGGVFLNKEREPQKIEFMIDDDVLSSFTVNDEDNRNYAIFIPEKYSAGKNFITLKIKTSYETAPNSFMDTSDDRQLAFKINSIKYETASAFKELFNGKRVSVKDIPDGLFLNGWYDKENDYIWGGGINSVAYTL